MGKGHIYFLSRNKYRNNKILQIKIESQVQIFRFFRWFLKGGYVGAVVVEESRKEVAGLFIDTGGKVLKAEEICDFKGSAYEPNIFFDSKRNEFFFTCTVGSGSVVNADFNLRSGLHMVVLTKRDAHGAHASNTESADTKNFVGYTNNTLAKTTGYYNEHTDR